MRLPNAIRALVELAKVADYLLNAAHPDNGGKASFFEALGFALDEPSRLAAALLLVAQTGDVVLSSWRRCPPSRYSLSA